MSVDLKNFPQPARARASTEEIVQIVNKSFVFLCSLHLLPPDIDGRIKRSSRTGLKHSRVGRWIINTCAPILSILWRSSTVDVRQDGRTTGYWGRGYSSAPIRSIPWVSL